MKRILFSLCAIAALVSCAKELNPATQLSSGKTGATEGTTIVAAGFADDVKTVLGPASGSSRPVYWQTGDAIQINGVNSTSIDINPANPAMANFTIGGVVDYPYHAVYPAALASGYEADTVTVILPAVQNYVAGSFDPKAAAMIAYATEGEVSFSHAMAFLKVKVSGGSNSFSIKSVRVRANMNRAAGSEDWGREPMSGEFKAVLSGTQISFARKLNDNSSVTLDCGEGVAQGTDLFIAIPAQAYHYGINLFVVSSDNQCQEIVSKKAFTAEAGKVYATSISYNGGMTYVGAGIYTAADWNAFAAQCTINDACDEFKDSEGEYILRNDLSDETFQRIGGILEGAGASTGPGCYFKGVLNGNGKTITATNQTVPFFTYISGTVKNLTLAGNKSVFSSTSGWGTAQMALDVMEGGLVDNCTIDFEVTAKPTADATTWYYGMFRNIKAGATVQNCTTKSDYTIDYNGVTTEDIYVLPFAYINEGTVKDCVNEGNINFVQDPGQRPIVGCIYKNSATLENFVNKGNFTVKASIGAIVCGVAVQGGGDINNCANGISGKSSECGVINLLATPTDNTKAFRAGGIAVYADGNEASNCGRYYGDINYGDITLVKNGTCYTSGTGIGGVCCFVRYGAYATSENHTFCVLDGCENQGHLTVHEPKVSGSNTAMYLGGIIGYCINANGLSKGALVLTRPTTEMNGNYVVCRANCKNTGTLELASANTSGGTKTISGARQTYVGGIAGFAYGMGRTSQGSDANNAHYAVIRGQQNGIIRVGSSASGNSCAGGILGGGCYVKVDGGLSNVTYEATTLKTNDKAPVYRGMLAGVIGYVVKTSNIGIDNSTAINATLVDNTGLVAAKNISTDTTLETVEALKGYAGVTGAKSVDNTSTTATHKVYVYGNPIATLNGNTITTADIYGGGNKSIDQN